jgi:hypothetical protein
VRLDLFFVRVRRRNRSRLLGQIYLALTIIEFVVLLFTGREREREVTSNIALDCNFVRVRAFKSWRGQRQFYSCMCRC